LSEGCSYERRSMWEYFFIIITWIFALCNIILGSFSFWQSENIPFSWSVECPSACNMISIIADVLQSASGKSVSLAHLWFPHQSSLPVDDNRIRSAPSQIDGSPSVSRYILCESGMKTHCWWSYAHTSARRDGRAIHWPLVSKLLRFGRGR